MGSECESPAVRAFIHPELAPVIACASPAPTGPGWRLLAPSLAVQLDMLGAGPAWHGRAGVVKRAHVRAGVMGPDRAFAVIQFPNRKRGVSVDARDIRPAEEFA